MGFSAFATVTGVPEWNLDGDEARDFAKAAAAVSRHYNINISAHSYDLVMLGSVAGNIVFRRLQYFAARRAAQREAEANATPIAPGYANGADGTAAPVGSWDTMPPGGEA